MLLPLLIRAIKVGTYNNGEARRDIANRKISLWPPFNFLQVFSYVQFHLPRPFMTTMKPPAMGTPVGSCSPTFPPNSGTSMAALPSSPSNSSSPSSTSYALCEGLDLLAMAALEAAGVGKEEKESNTDQGDSRDADNGKLAMARKGDGGVGGVEFGPVQKRRRQSLMPSRYQDSFPSFSTSCSRCRGLDLLAMAALQVSGAAEEEQGERDGEACDGDDLAMVVQSQSGIGLGGVEFGALVKRSRRRTLMPSKYQDSVLQPWKRGSRKRRPPAAAGRLG
ncbi:hypothetical protein Taro_045729 [Colocasia esculenta]|uniref:Uncharacterized protein n=1 Tax=Colocasia esculenta TaxID=4460 RepID=A0A843X0T5_COLES|nr:hypothetical protein [Colocasia esculenta]